MATRAIAVASVQLGLLVAIVLACCVLRYTYRVAGEADE